MTTITMRNTGLTDHLSFDAVGIPGFQFVQDLLDYESRTHHSNQDVMERLQAADLKQIATVEAIFWSGAREREKEVETQSGDASRPIQGAKMTQVGQRSMTTYGQDRSEILWITNVVC